jgi:Tfp pilus assembly protein PilO
MNKMRQWSLFTAVAVLVVFAAGWFLAVSPQRSKVAELHTQAATQQSSNSQLQAQLSQLQAEKRGLPAQQRVLSEFATKIPDNPALPALVRQLSAAAVASGVDLVSLAPTAPAPLTASAVTTSSVPVAGAASSAPATQVDQIAIAVHLQGSYYNVESFFAAVEKLGRAVKVSQFTAAPAGGGTSSSPASGSSSGGSAAADGPPALAPGTLDVTLTANVFMAPPIVPSSVSPTAPAAPAN